MATKFARLMRTLVLPTGQFMAADLVRPVRMGKRTALTQAHWRARLRVVQGDYARSVGEETRANMSPL